jgi:hypothetical protein
MPRVGGTVTPTDIASMYQGAVDDRDFAALLQGLSYGAQAVIATATGASTPTLTAVTKRVGAQYPVPVSQIYVNDIALGVGISPGTFVASVSGGGSTVVLTRTVTITGAMNVAFVRPNSDLEMAGITYQGVLYVPNRGFLKVLPGDVVAQDNIGFPFLISGNSIGYAASQWTLV